MVETATGIRDSAVETYHSAKDSVVETYADTKDMVVEGYQDTKAVVVETAADVRDTAVSGARAVGRGLETGALVTLGAGILVAEAAASAARKGVNISVELGERGLAAGQRFVEEGVEKARQSKETAARKMTEMRAKTAYAINSVAVAVKEKTVEAVNAGREYVKNGVVSAVEAGTALKERTKDGINSAWERMKTKKNDIKRSIVGGWFSVNANISETIGNAKQRVGEEMLRKAEGHHNQAAKLRVAIDTLTPTAETSPA